MQIEVQAYLLIGAERCKYRETGASSILTGVLLGRVYTIARRPLTNTGMYSAEYQMLDAEKPEHL